MIKKLRVTVDGKAYDVTVELPDETAAPPAPPVSQPAGPAASSVAHGGVGAGDVPCPLGGRVVAIDARPGQDVKEGDRLMTVETMKMNTFICAHKAGKVGEILVAVGETVDEGRILARII